MIPSLSVIILTYNEEENITQALKSVCGWTSQVFVLDSYSSDQTREISNQFNCQFIQNRFEGYPEQRNWALDNLPIHSEWILFLDADEWLSEELKKEIEQVLSKNPLENGFYIKRRLIWMGKWIKHGYYPTWILRLFRFGKGYCEKRSVNEHFIVEGTTGKLKHDIIHEDRKSLGDWIAKHYRFSLYEAQELFRERRMSEYIDMKFFGSQPEHKRWLRYKVWNRLPLFLRPFIYFIYRFIIRGGFLDGKEGLIYHFLQGLWFPFLIDVNYEEIKKSRKLH